MSVHTKYWRGLVSQSVIIFNNVQTPLDQTNLRTHHHHHQVWLYSFHLVFLLFRYTLACRRRLCRRLENVISLSSASLGGRSVDVNEGVHLFSLNGVGEWTDGRTDT